MKGTKPVLFAVAALLSLMMAGCGQEKPDVTFSAVIDEVHPYEAESEADTHPLGTILVVTEDTDITSGDKAYVDIPDGTPVLKADGTEGGFGGTVRDSYPVQITASKIIIEKV